MSNGDQAMSGVTIDEAIEKLQHLRSDTDNPLGGEALLVLSLSGSGLEVVAVDELHLDLCGDGACVEVRVTHPALMIDS